MNRNSSYNPGRTRGDGPIQQNAAEQQTKSNSLTVDSLSPESVFRQPNRRLVLVRRITGITSDGLEGGSLELKAAIKPGSGSIFLVTWELPETSHSRVASVRTCRGIYIYLGQSVFFPLYTELSADDDACENICTGLLIASGSERIGLCCCVALRDIYRAMAHSQSPELLNAQVFYEQQLQSQTGMAMAADVMAAARLSATHAGASHFLQRIGSLLKGAEFIRGAAEHNATAGSLFGVLKGLGYTEAVKKQLVARGEAVSDTEYKAEVRRTEAARSLVRERQRELDRSTELIEQLRNEREDLLRRLDELQQQSDKVHVINSPQRVNRQRRIRIGDHNDSESSQ